MNNYILSGINGNIGSLLRDEFTNVIKYDKDLKIDSNFTFIHLAAKSNGNYKSIVNSNINYLLEVIDFCKKNKIEKLIFFSAISINNKDTIYEASKVLGEKILKDTGLKVLILRLPMILSKDTKEGVLNRIVNKLEENRDVIIYNENEKFNNFVSIDYICNFIKSYKFHKEYEIINLSIDKKKTLLEIVKILKKLVRSNSRIIKKDKKVKLIKISNNKAKKYFTYKTDKINVILKKWIKMRGK